MKVLLNELFNHDFSQPGDAKKFYAAFFRKPLSIAELHKVCDAVCASSVDINGKSIPAALRIKGKEDGAPFAILAQTHGNEPAGLAGIALAMALADAGKLTHDVIGIIGNPLAAKQYFAAWEQAPQARQEIRDVYRCGLSPDGTLLPDMNRIPIDFLTREPADPHITRARELYTLATHVRGIVDIHSARGNMLCVTDHEYDAHLKNSPIRSVLTGLAQAISAHASTATKVQTFKTIAVALPNIECEIGIEAGRHESPEAPYHAASFTLSLLHTLGITSILPLYRKETGVFTRYEVKPRLTFNDLAHDALPPGDRVYLAKTCDSLEAAPARSDRLIIRQENGDYAMQTILQYIVKPAGEIRYAIYQYDEMEAVEKGQVVAVALPSGVEFKAPVAFSGIFLSKSATLYNKDPSVGPWPVAGDKIAEIKFCYPCEVGEMKINF